MKPDMYQIIRKKVPPHDYEIKDKRRYDKSDRHDSNQEIQRGIEEYYDKSDRYTNQLSLNF